MRSTSDGNELVVEKHEINQRFVPRKANGHAHEYLHQTSLLKQTRNQVCD